MAKARKTLSQKLKEEQARSDRLQQELVVLQSALAADQGPLALTIAVNRLTGRFSRTIVLDRSSAEAELRMLIEALRQVEEQLQAELLRLVEMRAQAQAERGKVEKK